MRRSHLLAVDRLSVGLKASHLPIVEDVSFSISPAERVGIVGESGSGKTITAMALLRLLSPESLESTGTVDFGGLDLLKATRRQLREVRGNEIAMVFQDPSTALNPVFSVGDQIRNVLLAHRKMSKTAAKRETIEMMGRAGIPHPSGRYSDYPHQLSGGLRQRCMIAAALICGPKLLIADEPTSALDPTVQAQIMMLLDGLAEERRMSVLFISHDLPLVAGFCSRVLTMYAGQLVDISNAGELADQHVRRHPYTDALLECAPALEDVEENGDFVTIPGQPPALDAMPHGCRFYPRCPAALPPCAEEPQELRPLARDRAVRCWRVTDAELAEPETVESASPSPQ